MPVSSHSFPMGHHRSVLPEFEIYIKGSRESIIFCVWRLSWHLLFVRSFQLLWKIVGSSSRLYTILLFAWNCWFFFPAICCSVVWMGHDTGVRLLLMGVQVVLSFFAVMNDVPKAIMVQVFCACISFE